MTSFKTALHSTKTLILGHLVAVIVIAIWGASFVSSDALLRDGMGPLEIAVYRFAIAYVVMVIISHKKWFCNSLKDEFLFMLCGLLAISIYYIAENVALKYTSTTNVSLLTSVSPLFTAMLVGIMYKSERPSGGAIIGSAVAFFGVACVIFNSAFSGDGPGITFGPIGDMLSLAAALSWAFYSIILRRLNANYDNLFITRKTFFYGVISAIPMWLCFDHVTPVTEIFTSRSILFNLGFLAFGASLLAFLLWSAVVKRVGAVKANNYIYLQPIFTLILSIIILGEKITFIGISGIILILGGLWLGDNLSLNWRSKAVK